MVYAHDAQREGDMGIDDQAAPAQGAGDEAKAGLEDAAAKAKEGLEGLLDKAKEFATDDRIEDAAEKIKGLTPDSIDSFVDKAAEQAKKLND
ncbi:hypothetical protein GCM10023221_06120 [Luteimicrobium xylanilyticum]|uniref:Uncharacterized protein n=1 Tax=Luteimicrobium xylanilyticum TaxID=1133546 RepID=A0A5P9QBF3_9MICO|nr:hypothetical protein [Luteimicrobium xylanilyticum]QFU98402.1 hypothetical protein KDY119_01914 [Luteimicrobium xylanilyticum]